MATATVRLEGSALTGYEPHLLTVETAAALPNLVCLGRNRPAARPACPHLSAFWREENMLAGYLPTSTNRRAKATESLARMYLNDRMGDCVIAGKCHALGLWSANDPDHDGPAIILATDEEIQSQYVGVCGPGDNGCNIASVLDYMRSQGFFAGGLRYKIDGYVAADWRNQTMVKTGIYALGAGTIGINLPQAWTQNSVWDTTNSQIVGGHDVTIVDFGPDGVYVSSWGRVYLITWRAFASTRWLEELYFMLSSTWYGRDMLAPCGIDVTGLRSVITSIGNGVVPPLPDPVPPTPVPPTPVPPVSGGIAMMIAYDSAGKPIQAFKPVVATTGLHVENPG